MIGEIYCLNEALQWLLHLFEEVDHLDDFVAVLVHVSFSLPHQVDQLKRCKVS